jgi:2-methylcitrate dehydratase
MPCRITVFLSDGRVLVKEKRDYEGFYSRPMQWEDEVRKFERLSAPYTDAALRRDIVGAVADLETISTTDLTRLLARAQVPGAGSAG